MRKNSEGLKADLEIRIIDHLLKNEASLSNNPEFSAYYSDFLPNAGYLTNGTKNSSRKKSAIVQKTLVKKTLFVNDQDNSSNHEVKNLETIFSAEKDGMRHLKINEIVEMPSGTLSKSALSDTICISDLSNDLTLKSDFNHCFRYYSTYDRLLSMRRRLSKVLVVDFLFCIYEFYNLLKFLIPWTYGIFLPSCFGSLSGKIFYLPDIFVFFSFEKFWSPFLTWWLLAIFVPLIAATIFNFHETKKGQRFKIIDPMTFSVVKAIVVYSIFYKGFRKNLFFMDSIFVVKRAVGVELMFIMSFIGILYAMYDTSISRK
ncbi:hypothetical protein PCANB_001754 [Pneumocystis canis]|nr:hypothetical protein PCANB_001754 [Pneumocystis canis]